MVRKKGCLLELTRKSLLVLRVSFKGLKLTWDQRERTQFYNLIVLVSKNELPPMYSNSLSVLASTSRPRLPLAPPSCTPRVPLLSSLPHPPPYCPLTSLPHLLLPPPSSPSQFTPSDPSQGTLLLCSILLQPSQKLLVRPAAGQQQPSVV